MNSGVIGRTEFRNSVGVSTISATSSSIDKMPLAMGARTGINTIAASSIAAPASGIDRRVLSTSVSLLVNALPQSCVVVLLNDKAHSLSSIDIGSQLSGLAPWPDYARRKPDALAYNCTETEEL